MDFAAKQREFEELKQRVAQLEREISEDEVPRWAPPEFYPAYQAAAGFVLGIFGAAAALLVNVIGAPIAGQHPLELIRVFLTFPLGARALQLGADAPPGGAVSDGMVLAFGCCLYLATGMLLGVPFQLALARVDGRASLAKRLAIASVLGLLLWFVNFHLILSWLQPALFGGDWITSSRFLPWWVAAGTHLVFAWTMALLYPLGRFAPDRPRGENA